MQGFFTSRAIVIIRINNDLKKKIKIVRCIKLFWRKTKSDRYPNQILLSPTQPSLQLQKPKAQLEFFVFFF